MRVTIREVAQQAGVSVATVSRVLNDVGPVTDATRKRVLEVARQLRYAPNVAARMLSTRRTGTLGVLLPNLHGEFFSEVIRGIDQTAQGSGFHILVSSSHNDRDEIEAAVRVMRGRVDGLLVMSPDLGATAFWQSVPERIPVVLLNSRADDSDHDTINVDNVGGVRAMTAHLLEWGHRRIAMIRGPERNHDAEERLAGYRQELREAGVDPEPELVVSGAFTDESGYEGARRLLRLANRPTAIIAANDAMAVGALRALEEAGVAVPDEIAVGGFDDIPMSRFLNPPLTTVHVAISELGARAVSRLLARVSAKNQEERRQETLPTTLVVRGSTGGAAGIAPRGSGITTHPYSSPTDGGESV